MRKYILIFGYTNFTKEETDYWNNLSLELNKNGYELFVIGACKPSFECHFFNAIFVEKLDDVSYGFFNGNQYPNDLYFQKYLEREVTWYGVSNKDRLTAAKFQKFRYSILLDELNPALVVLGNGEHANELILKDEILMREIPLIYFERGSLPNTWHVDNLGITAGTSIASKKYSEIKITTNESYLKYKVYYSFKKQTWWQQPKNNEIVNIRKRFEISAGTKIILFANQLDNDTSNFLYSPYFKNNLEAFDWFCSELKKVKSDCFILIKKHPFFKGSEIEFQKTIELYGLIGKWIDDISIIDCLEQCDLFCAVNSTAIYEAMMHEKPVLQLGKSILSNKDITYEINNLNQTEVINNWVNSVDFSIRLSNFEHFMAYLIDNELSFFVGDCSELGFNNHTFFQKRIIEKVDTKRMGNYPNRFIESKFEAERLILNGIPFSRLINLNFEIVKELFFRVYKKMNKLFIN